MNQATNIPVFVYNEIRKRLTDSTVYSYEQIEYFIVNTIQGLGLAISKQVEKYKDSTTTDYSFKYKEQMYHLCVIFHKDKNPRLALYIQADNELTQVDGAYSNTEDDHKLLWQRILCR